MFNLKNYKVAQIPTELELPEETKVSSDDLRSQLDDILKKNMANRSELETALDSAYETALSSTETQGNDENALNMVKSVLIELFPENQDDISDALRVYLESEKDSIENDDAKKSIYDAYVSSSLAEPTGTETTEPFAEEPTAEEEITEIPSDFIEEPTEETEDMPTEPMTDFANTKKPFNLKKASLQKTAGGWGGGSESQSYGLYGPQEKRYCPKLRNVISLFNCRFYCVDGLPIDDYRVLCGEAIWRQNIMDKFSRAYRDAEGKYVGGYIDKRFEVHHDTENSQYQLKPGQRRRPLSPDEYSVERRMSQQREGELPKSISPKEKTASVDDSKKKT